ncbi:nitroreductase [Variovorax paradoxus]|uniref:nitroreductase n=1 Tax=Variovorax paradoxus TaxID=34073 RepID=UPI002785B197|nr:nitroreductase [Variovorax paradoxus]MDP9962878.1 nitroreductase [Variovorax paradoxus]
MKIQDAVSSRLSVREFLDTPVDPEILRRVLSQAIRAPSGGNLQPWHLHVVGGTALHSFKDTMQEMLRAAPMGEAPDYDIYPRELPSPYRERRFQVGEDLYGRLQIPREDKSARQRWFQQNFAFFGAPVALFCSVHRGMGPPQWSDLGMLLQTIMLLLRAEGLHSCAQECWAILPRTVESFLQLPPKRMLFTGMSIGYEKEDSPVNKMKTERAPLADVADFIGF